ncbi:MAG: response regulator [Magnetococcus sp. DMHC-6]
MVESLCVLVVDDNLLERTLLVGLLNKLTQWNMHTLSCAHGDEAIELIGTNMPDLCFIDYHLDHEMGTDLIGRIKQAGFLGGFILFTAMEGEEIIVAALRAGADDYLRKRDLNVDTLTRALRHTLERIQHQQALQAANNALEQIKIELEKRVQERTSELDQTRQQLNFITSAAHDAILMIDPEGRIMFWNPAAERLFGFTSKETIGKDIGALLIPPATRKAFATGFKQFSRTGKGKWINRVNELTTLRKQGSPFFVEMSLSAFQIDKNWYAVGIARDITQRKRADNALLKAKKEAEDATHLKDRFVSLVAHDLRGPFTAILGFLELLANDRKNPLTKKQRNLVNWATESSRKMLEMVDELLNISRLQTGKIQPQLRFINARHLADQTLNRYRPLAENKEVAISNDLPEHMRLYADPSLLGEVLSNLVSNSVKFCRPGDRLTLFQPPGKPTSIAVQDTGVGIREKRLSRLFKLEEKTTTIGTAGERGTGFGLPFSLELIKAQGGNLTAVSQEDKGSTFTIRLPKVTPRVLIVDDDADLRLLLSTYLVNEQVTLLEASSGLEAKKILTSQMPHLVICDVMLSDFSGFDLLTAIRSDPKLRGLPFLFITADESILTKEKAFQIGANDFVTKPILLHDFLPRVRRFLG